MDGVENQIRSDLLLKAQAAIDEDDGAASDRQEKEEGRVTRAGGGRYRHPPVEEGARKPAEEAHQNRKGQPLHEGQGAESIVL